jgi:hypothetical protein
MDAVQHADAMEGSGRKRRNADAGSFADTDTDTCANTHTNTNTHADASTVSDGLFLGMVEFAGLCEHRQQGDVQRPQLSEQVVDSGR